MALYRLSVRTHSKAAVGSIVAGAAYRAGENLVDHTQDKTHRYANRQHAVVQTGILAPANAPDWVYQREDLWNEVQASNSRANARFAREMLISLPRELRHDQNWALVHSFVERECVGRGMVADIAFHDTEAADGERNPHAHVLLTTRTIDRDGFGQVETRWNHKGLIEHWRTAWEDHANDALDDAGSEARIDHRSHKNQEVDAEPHHMPREAMAMEERGVESHAGDHLARRAMREKLAQQADRFENQLAEIEPAPLSFWARSRETLSSWADSLSVKTQSWRDRVTDWISEWRDPPLSTLPETRSPGRDHDRE